MLEDMGLRGQIDGAGGLGQRAVHYRVHDAIKGTETTVAEIAQCVADRYLS